MFGPLGEDEYAADGLTYWDTVLYYQPDIEPLDPTLGPRELEAIL
jgi:hypothetical protein